MTSSNEASGTPDPTISSELDRTLAESEDRFAEGWAFGRSWAENLAREPELADVAETAGLDDIIEFGFSGEHSLLVALAEHTGEDLPGQVLFVRQDPFADGLLHGAREVYRDRFG